MVMLKHRWMGCRYIFDRKHINTSIAFLERYHALVGIYCNAMQLFCSAVITNDKLRETNCLSWRWYWNNSWSSAASCSCSPWQHSFPYCSNDNSDIYVNVNANYDWFEYDLSSPSVAMKWELTIQVPKKNEVGIDNTSAEEEWSGNWQYKCRRRMKWELTIQVPKQCRCKHNDLTFTNLVNLNSNNTWTNLIVDLTLLSNNGHSIL